MEQWQFLCNKTQGETVHRQALYNFYQYLKFLHFLIHLIKFIFLLFLALFVFLKKTLKLLFWGWLLIQIITL